METQTEKERRKSNLNKRKEIELMSMAANKIIESTVRVPVKVLPVGGYICKTCGNYIWKDGWGQKIVFVKQGENYYRNGEHDCKERK